MSKALFRVEFRASGFELRQKHKPLNRVVKGGGQVLYGLDGTWFSFAASGLEIG